MRRLTDISFHQATDHVLVVKILIDTIYDKQLVTQVEREIEQADPPCRIVVDLEKVKFMGKALLGGLIRLHQHCARKGGLLCLCRLTETATEVFHITRMDEFFSICDQLGEAIEQAVTSNSGDV